MFCISTPEPPFELELSTMLNHSEDFSFLDSLLVSFPFLIPHTSTLYPS
jgi:hypothetical protein